MKKLSALFALLFVSGWTCAEPLKTVFNPFTGKQDYITRIDSNTILPGGNCTSTSNSNGTVTINCVGGGGGTSGTINNAAQFSDAYYSFTGSSNVISGLTPGASGYALFSAGTTAAPFFAPVSSGFSIYPATATASFPFGLTASTMTISTQTVTGEIILKDGTIIASTSTFGGSSTPAGPFTAVQYNSTGTFNGNANFTTDGSSVAVSSMVAGAFTVIGSSNIPVMIIPKISSSTAMCINNMGSVGAFTQCSEGGTEAPGMYGLYSHLSGTGGLIGGNGQDIVAVTGRSEVTTQGNGWDYGGQFISSGSAGSSGSNIGAYGESNVPPIGTSGSNFGFWGQVQGTNAAAVGHAIQGISLINGGTNYGGWFTAQGAGNSTNVGIYANASGGSNNGHALEADGGQISFGNDPSWSFTSPKTYMNIVNYAPSVWPWTLGVSTGVHDMAPGLYVSNQGWTLISASETVTGAGGITSTFGVSAATETVTYNLNIGSMTGAGLTSCSGGSNAVTWNSGTNLFGCNTISGSGGGASTLGVAKGQVLVSSPTALISFDSNTINVALQGGATAFVSLNPSSVTLQGLITAASLGALTANQNITISGDVTGSGATSIATTAALTQANIRTFSGPITHTSSTTFMADVIVSSAVLLAGTPGTNGQVFTSAGNGANPTWTTVSAGAGSGIVSPGTFTWTNNFGFIVSTIQANAFNATVTSVTVTGNGGFAVQSSSAGQISMTEGAASTVVGTASGIDSFWADSSSHTLEFNPNNTSTYTVAGTSSTIVPGHILAAGTFVGSIIDGGVLGAGSVTSVTGTPPINSSGGTTPAISLSQTIGQSETITGSSLTVGGIQGLSVSGATTAPLVTISSVPTGIALVSVSSTPASSSPDFVTLVSSQNGTPVFGVQYDGHIVSSGTTPSMGTCGSSPSVVGTDGAAVITVGSGVVTSCTMNFANVWANPPVCVESDNSTAVTGDITTTTTSSITFGFSATLGGGQVNVICIGQKG